MQPPVDEHVRRLPASALRRHIAWYTGWRQVGVPPAEHRGLPSPWLTLILTLDDPLDVARHPDPRQRPGRFETLVGGLHTAPALITHAGRQSGVQLALHPLGARALLGLPAGELAGQDVPADVVLGPVGVQLHERLRTAVSWPARFAVLDEVLTEICLTGRRAAEPELPRAWELLHAGAGVGEVAADVGWSPRRLAARFEVEVGLSPKATARVMRFDRARRLLPARVGDLAGLAADCGYYDQAHLNRDFRQFAGLPPTAWLAAEGDLLGAVPEVASTP